MKKQILLQTALITSVFVLPFTAKAATEAECQVAPEAFSAARMSNEKFNIERASQAFRSECANICNGDSCSDDDLRSALGALYKRVVMQEHCQNENVAPFLRLGDKVPAHVQRIIRSRQKAFADSKAAYISPTTAIENIDKYQHLNAVSRMRMRVLDHDVMDKIAPGSSWQIGLSHWNLIYTNFQVIDLHVQVGACAMVWTGDSPHPVIKTN